MSPPPAHSVHVSAMPSFHGSHMTANCTAAANWGSSGYGAMIQVEGGEGGRERGREREREGGRGWLGRVGG